jgi:hypothetical protein
MTEQLQFLYIRQLNMQPGLDLMDAIHFITANSSINVMLNKISAFFSLRSTGYLPIYLSLNK